MSMIFWFVDCIGSTRINTVSYVGVDDIVVTAVTGKIKIFQSKQTKGNNQDNKNRLVLPITERNEPQC